jgi:hypothetical protein
MFVLLIKEIYQVHCLMASCDMTYIPSFMKTGADVQAILRVCLRYLRVCNVGITA